MNKLDYDMIKAVADTLRLDEHKITLQSKFVDDLGADSLDLVELMMAIETTFNCSIPDEDAGQISTVQDAVDYVKKRMETEKAL